jgi:hypothetical protein
VEAGSFFSLLRDLWELLEADTMLLAPFFLRAECYSASAGDSLRVIGDSSHG